MVRPVLINRLLLSRQVASLVLMTLLVVLGLLSMSRVYGDQLPVRSVTLGTAQPGVSDIYSLSFRLPNAEMVGSVRLQVCAESPLISAPCTPPAGLDMSSLVLGSQSGATGFNVANSTVNTVILGRSPTSVAANTQMSYQLKNISNPSSAGSYFGRIEVFATSDGSGGYSDYGGLAFAINNSLQVSTYVPPYLYFCVGVSVTGTDCTTATGDYINFGNFSPAITSAANSQMVAGTNADSGYAIVASGTTLTSGTNIIAPLATGNTSRPGTSQFGLNLVANQDPQIGSNPSGTGTGVAAAGYSQSNQYKFVPGDTVVSVPAPDEPRNYTVSYIANIAKDQAPGIYVTTLTYIATGTF